MTLVDMRLSWTVDTRRVVRSIMNIRSEAEALRFDLSAEACHPYPEHGGTWVCLFFFFFPFFLSALILYYLIFSSFLHLIISNTRLFVALSVIHSGSE